MAEIRIAHPKFEPLRFLRGWLREPLAVGALFPTSAATAARMAAPVRADSGLPVLELGAGTGVITQAILDRGVSPENLYSVESDPDFADCLREHFARVNVLEGDAFELDRLLGARRGLTFDCVVCAVPLFSFPPERRLALVNDLLDRIPAGRPVVQITHGLKSPIPEDAAGVRVEKFAFVPRNLPPAHLWLYTKA